jgi:hypothetical protein
VFAAGLRHDRRVIERWATFDAQIGIVDRGPDVSRASSSRCSAAADPTRRRAAT